MEISYFIGFVIMRTHYTCVIKQQVQHVRTASHQNMELLRSNIHNTITIQHGVASNVAKQLYLSITGTYNLISPLIIIFDSMEIMQ